MLNDDIGSALALNRLAVVFFKRKKYDLSYMYHGKHAQQADDNDKFVAIYNSGISSRLLGEYHRAASEFHEALNISTPRNVSDTNFLTMLCIKYDFQSSFVEIANFYNNCTKYITQERKQIVLQGY